MSGRCSGCCCLRLRSRVAVTWMDVTLSLVDPDKLLTMVAEAAQFVPQPHLMLGAESSSKTY